jgi:hypothetical protein
MPVRIPREHEDGIVAAYLEGKLPTEAGALFGHSQCTALRVLHRRGIAIRPRTLSHREREQVVQDFDAGLSIPKLAIKYGCSAGLCNGILRRAGRTIPKRCAGGRKYHFHEAYFETVDSEEKAYWLGFLTADGNITDVHEGDRHRSDVSLGLAWSDYAHVQAFRDAVGSIAPILKIIEDETRFPQGHVTLNTYSARLVLHSVQMVADLRRLGVHPRKSLTQLPWEGPEHLLRHYYRGLVDGDGSLSFHTRRQPYKDRVYEYEEWGVNLAGTLAVTQGFVDFVARQIGHQVKPCRQGKIWVSSYCGLELPQKVARVLYQDVSIALDRKKALAERLMAIAIEPSRWAHLTKEELLEKYLELRSWSAVGRYYGMSSGTMHHVRKKLGVSVLYPTRWAHLALADLNALREQLGSWAAVAKRLGMRHATTVHLVRRKLKSKADHANGMA